MDKEEIVRDAKNAGSRELEKDLTRGELTCLACGLVLEENLVTKVLSGETLTVKAMVMTSLEPAHQ